MKIVRTTVPKHDQSNAQVIEFAESIPKNSANTKIECPNIELQPLGYLSLLCVVGFYK